MIQLGISTFTYKWSFGIKGYASAPEPLDAEKLIRRAKALGVDLVQIGDNYPLRPQMQEELLALKALSDELSIDLEIGTSGTVPATLLETLRVAEVLGARLIRSRVGSPSINEDMTMARHNLEGVLDKFESAGILLSLENYETYSVHALADLLTEFDSPFLGACLDTTNSLGALETPKTVVDALGPFASCVHVKDFQFKRIDYGLGYVVQGCRVGTGQLDVPELLQSVRNNGRLKSVVLEQWTPYQGSVEETVDLQDRWAEESIDYLQRILSTSP